MHTASPNREYHLVGPLFLLSGLLLAAIPIFHPNNTCHDWLEKWGQLAVQPIWVPIHQVAMAGYALGAVAALALPWFAPRTKLGFLGAGAVAAGLAILSSGTVIHATAVSVLGRAHNAAASAESRAMIRLFAESWMGFDVATGFVGATLLSLGAIPLCWHLSRAGVLSPPAAVFFAACAMVMSLQAYGVFRYLHVPTTEWVPFVSLAGFLAGLGLILLWPRPAAGD